MREHNEVIHHAAFEGQTPNETYFGTGEAVVVRLTAMRIKARDERIGVSGAAACRACKSDTSSAALRLQRPRSGTS